MHRSFSSFHRLFFYSENCPQNTGEEFRAFQYNYLHYVLSFHALSRNIPEMISTAATVKSSTFIEKNEMHISAARKAATASSNAGQQFFRFFRRLLMPSPPVVSLPYIIPQG